MVFYPHEKLALFIDGANLYAAARTLGFDIEEFGHDTFIIHGVPALTTGLTGSAGEQIGSVTGAREHERLTSAHVARLIASPEGLLKGSEGRRVIPVINMVDDREREVLARETAQHALELSDRLYRIVLTSLRDPHDPVVAVIER